VIELTPETAAGYLTEHGVVPADAECETRSLGGGVSNRVVELSWDGGCVVAKQPRPNLAVEADWPADLGRVHNEAAAARTYEAVIEEGNIREAAVPSVVFEAQSDHVVAFECAPADAEMWKRTLLDGRVDTDVARLVGKLLGNVHGSTAGDGQIRQQFENKRPFEQLRLDPYHWTTAERHPDVADLIEAEIERVSSVERTLVHGDYSPKNVLVERDPFRVWVLDFEVAHWGDPAFDTAFMLNHLCIKSVYNHERHREYVDAALAFRDAYREQVSWEFEAATARELGVLMLARVDGKSPVEYVEEGAIAETLRRVAKRILEEEVASIEGFAAVADEEVDAL